MSVSSVLDAIATVLLLGGFWAVFMLGVVALVGLMSARSADREIRLRQRARVRRMRGPHGGRSP